MAKRVIVFFMKISCPFQPPKIGRFGCKFKGLLFTPSTAHPMTTVIEIDFIEQKKSYYLRPQPLMKSL